MPAQAIVLPTRAGRIVLAAAPSSARCATGCRTLGGGLLLATVFADGRDQPEGVIPICGNCLAVALAHRIDDVQREQGHPSPRERTLERLLIRGNTLAGVTAAALDLTAKGREISSGELDGYVVDLRRWAADVRAVASEQRGDD